MNEAEKLYLKTNTVMMRMFFVSALFPSNYLYGYQHQDFNQHCSSAIIHLLPFVFLCLVIFVFWYNNYYVFCSTQIHAFEYIHRDSGHSSIL